MNRKYEIMFIIEPQAEAQTKANLKQIFEEHHAQILKEEDMGIRTLAYKIKKRDRAFYYLVQLEMKPASIEEVKKEFRLNENLLKYMALLLKEKKKKVKPPKPKKKSETSEAPPTEAVHVEAPAPVEVPAHVEAAASLETPSN